MISENSRDILLFLQCLHVVGLIEPKSITVDEPKLKGICDEWFNHKSVQLSINQGELKCTAAPTPKNLVDTYKELLKRNSECKNTTDLANTYYFQRIREVEELIRQNKDEFKKQLDLNRVV